MHRKVHIKIAKALSKKLCLTSEQERIFLKAIVEPDKWRLRNPKSKHHYLKYYTILDHVIAARSNLLRGENSTCLWRLGIALHFIQDAHVPSPRTKYRQRMHASLGEF